MENISIRGRVAYTICLFEKYLIYNNCNVKEWINILEKLWSYTNTEYLDDWMYEMAEYMPNSVLEDSYEGCEYISHKEFEELNFLYKKTNPEILNFLQLIYDIGTMDLYSKLIDKSIDTIKKINIAIQILENSNIEILSVAQFKQYSFNEYNGWGKQFNGEKLSIIL